MRKRELLNVVEVSKTFADQNIIFAVIWYIEYHNGLKEYYANESKYREKIKESKKDGSLKYCGSTRAVL